MAVKILEKKYGGLNCLEIEGNGIQASLTVILMHGYGADCTDLAGLVNVIRAPAGTRWLFPNGPQKVQIGPHMEGRAWFPISIAQLEAMNRGSALDFAQVVPPGLSSSRASVERLIEDSGVRPEASCIGGFSQGAMIATDVALRGSGIFKGLAVLSGSLVCRDQWLELAKPRHSLRYFQSHGDADQVLPYSSAQRLNEEVLKAAGLKGRFVRFRGGHEIPLEVCAGLSEFLFTLV